MRTLCHIGQLILWLVGLSLISAGCQFPGSTKPVIKIGLIAPFEGEGRPFGYQRLYGVKLALQEVNLAGGLAGYKFELVALNDYGDGAETALQARELVLDSDVKGVIGQWEPALQAAAAPIYAEAQLASVEPDHFAKFDDLPESFDAAYQTLAGSPAGPQARQAYLATQHLLKAIETAGHQSGTPERVNVLKALHILDQN